MPFNIELTKTLNGVSFKIQAVKNTLSVYFTGPEQAANEALRNWRHLESHFIEEMPGYNDNWVRGSDMPHVKRNHTHENEVKQKHFHNEFSSDITPPIIYSYLRHLHAQQKLSEHAEKEYQFLVDKDEVNEIVQKFQTYYQEYKGSSTEELYQEATALSDKEQAAYEDAVKEKKTTSSLSSLLTVLIYTSGHPLYRIPNQVTSNEPEKRSDLIFR